MKNKTLLSIFFIFLLSFATAWASSITLSSKTDNTNILATAANGDKHNVTLSDRTIFADGSWNTLTLPFSLTASQIAASPLADFTIKEMNTAKSGLDGEKLTLDFKDATSIVAGRPYIVKWQTNAKYDLLIRNKSDWDAFANRVNNGETFEGKVVMLASDFDNSTEPVTKMVGYYSWDETNKVATSKPFKGVFDGNGRTLTVNISSNEQYTAPFRSVIGATIKNLTVAGNIQVSNKLIGGMIAFAAGNNLISKCRVSATITSSVNGDGTVGGFVSNIQGGSTSIENSLFDGSFVGSNTTRWSGFVGWIESMATASHTETAGLLSISYSLFSPASIDVKSNNGNSTFYRGRSGYTPTLTICYYTKSFADGNNQGKKQNLSYESDLVSKLGSTDWALVSNKPVPKMTTTPTSHDDIIDPTFQNVTINAKASTVATSTDGYVILKGTYAPFANVDGLLFDEHNTANGAFYAALGTTTRDGYTLSGWYTDEGKLTLVTSIPFASDGNATLYAEFTIVTYTITYNGVKGASFETANPITYTVESGDILLNNPSKEGYEFVGWYNNAGFEGSAITGVAIASGSYGDKTFYAKWKKFLTHTDITVADIADQIYTGAAICPDVVVKDGETPLELGNDYTISCTNNISIGTADMTITGMGTYAGLISKTFKIVPKEITFAWDEQTSFFYNGTEQAPKVKIEGLVNDDDCTITVSGAEKEVGTYTATATVKCNDNYNPTTGYLETQFKITYTNLANLKGDYTVQSDEVLEGELAGNYKISIADGATVTLKGVTINGVDNWAYGWAGLTCQGDCNIILAENSVNIVKGFYESYPGIYVPSDKTLTISGTGSLEASSNGQGAGIGGGYNVSCGNIMISGGSITATGGRSAAGIGGSYKASVGSITISGGTITATGGGSAAGIGGGSNASVGDITISGGETKVFATKGGGAPYSIGRGYSGSRKGKITIGDIESSDIDIRTFDYTKWMNKINLLTHTDISVADVADQIYTGAAICPDVVVKDGETLLERDADYTVKCTNNISVGTADMTITGKNYYEGSISKTFEITQREITVAWGGLTLLYNGAEQAPMAKVDGLANDDDCSITVSGAGKEVGTYTATATVVCNDNVNYKLPTEIFEVQFEIFKGINLASLTSDFVVQDGYVLGGTLDGSKQPYKISIADGATVTLKGVTINGVDDEKYKWAGITCEGDCHIILAENSENKVKGFYADYPGIYVPEGYTLTISGTGSLDASSSGVGSYLGGAGIGCGLNISCGNIVIRGGTVTAKGAEDAAGIGSSYSSAGSITISGGSITATGGWGGAGIGSGYYGSVGNIEISGGTITATGGVQAAGIGGGQDGAFDNITISGTDTKVTAIKGEYAPYSIGKGAFGSRTGTITIGGIETPDIETSTGTFKYPYLMLVYEDGNGKHAVLNGEYSGDESVNITEDIENVAVTFNRTFKQSGFATIVLPFDYDANDLEGVKSIIEFTGMRRKANGDTTVGMSYVWCNKDVQDSLEELATAAKKKCLEENGENCEDLGKFEHCNEQDYYANAGKMVAYTPYMVQMGTANISFKSNVTLKKTITPEARVGDWVFRGTLESHVWTDDETKDGKIWAFAGKVQQSAKYVGQFVKLGGGASATALKAYMICEPKQQNPVQQVRKYVYNAYPTSSSGDRVFAPVSRLAAANPPALAGVETSSLESLDVVIVSRDQNKSEERTTIIGSKGKRTGEIRMNRNRGMFDLKGRRVNESKKAKGVYYKR